MDVFGMLSILLLFCTLAITGIQTYLLRKQIKADHEWKRRERALLFSKIYNESLRETQNKLMEAFGYIQANESPLTTDAIAEAFKQDPSLKNDVSFLLSYLENIGLAVRHNIASFEVVYDLMANTYLKYYYVFHLHIQKSRQRNPRLWENIEFLTHEIEKETEKRKTTPTRLPQTDR